MTVITDHRTRAEADMKVGIAVLALAGLMIAAGRGAHDPPPDPPAGFGSVLAALRSDLGQLNGDLRGEQADIAHGRVNRDGPCYNLVANVNYDVIKKVDYTVLTSVTHDRGRLGERQERGADRYRRPQARSDRPR